MMSSTVQWVKYFSDLRLDKGIDERDGAGNGALGVDPPAVSVMGTREIEANPIRKISAYTLYVTGDYSCRIHSAQKKPTSPRIADVTLSDLC